MDRRNFLKSSAAFGGLLAFAPLLIGCPSDLTQSKLAQLVAEIGTGLGEILPDIKKVSASTAATIVSSFQALETAVQAWVPGGILSEIEQAVNAFVGNIGLLAPFLPALAAIQPEIALIVAVVEGIITMLVPNATPTTMGMAPKSAALIIDAKTQFPNPPRTAAEFRSKWNSLAKSENRSDLTID